MDNPARTEAAPLLLRTIERGVATLTLNRPEEYNLLSGDMLAALDDALNALARDPAARVVILAATGPAFCAGHDLKTLRGGAPDAVQQLFTFCTQVMERLRLFAKPTIAQVQGNAVAAGLQLASSCDLVMAAEGARFGATGIKAGLFCSTPMVPFSRAVTGKKALEMLLTGDMLEASAMEALGLVNHVVPPAELADRTMELALKIARNSPYALAIGKQAYYRQKDMPMEHAYQIGQETMVGNILSEEGQEGITAFLEKRKPSYSDI